MSASEPTPEPVGSIAEEAFKLFRTMSSSSSSSASANEAVNETHTDHVCSTSWCPVCQVVGFVRDNPEAIASVTSSAAGLARSVRDLVETAMSPREKP